MKQLLIHAHDQRTGKFLPVYRVCVTADRTALVRAVQDGWEKTAEGIEARLNREAGRGLEGVGCQSVMAPGRSL